MLSLPQIFSQRKRAAGTLQGQASGVLGAPDVVVDITGYEERKMRVLEAHASQTGPMLKNLAADSQQAEEARDMWMKTERFYSYTV